MRSLILLSFIFITSVGHAQTTEQVIENLELKRKAVESVIDKAPYNDNQHLAIEGYFKGLNQFALDVKDYSNTNKRFNNVVSKIGIESFCSKVFLDKKRWEDLVRNCTQNNFFLCAEEVRALPDIKASLKNSLWETYKKAYDSAKTCKGL